MSTSANRGKKAEGVVQKFLTDLSARQANFDFQRNYDAHSAGGKFPAQTGDFTFFRPGEHGVIEVKETANASRLPYKNFETPQVNKCRLRALAGGQVIVLVCHTKANEWRVLPLAAFLYRDPSTPYGSWDLSASPALPWLHVVPVLLEQMGLPPA